MLRKIYFNISYLFERQFYFLYFCIALTKQFVISNIKIIFIVKKNRINFFSKKTIIEKKKSDTIFILGGGETINEINKNQWSIIKNSDSLGINRWIYHNFVTNFYMIEGCKKKELIELEEIEKSVYETWQNSESRSKNSIFLIKDLDQLVINFPKLTKFKSRMYSLFKLVPPAKTSKGLKKSFKILSKLKFLNNICFPPGSKASVSHALSFALLAGYDNIILCGFDLHGGYFWDNCNKNDLFANVPQVEFLKRSSQLDSKINDISKISHKTQVPSDNSDITAKEVILEISKYKKHNQNIYVSSKNSLLSKHLPVYW